MFGKVFESPLKELQFGLVLGSEALIARVRQILDGKPGSEELRSITRIESAEARGEVARHLARRQEEQTWQIWARVILDGERRVDIAREFEYRDGSAITQILKRLAIAAQSYPEIAARMDTLKTKHAKMLSRIKS